MRVDWRWCTVSSVLLLAQPPIVVAQSDDCASATSIAGEGSFGFDNSSATTDGIDNVACFANGSSSIGHDVWFCWSSLLGGEITISTCSQTTVDTRLAVYDGCACPEGTGILACNDDACLLQSSVTFTAVAGQSYLIRVGTPPGEIGGSGMIVISRADDPPGNGPDVIVGDLPNVSHYGSIGDVHAYSIGTTSCNIGDENLQWDAATPEHPVIAQNVYRLAGGRFEQIGMSWLKHGYVAITGTLCGDCNGLGGSVLGVGCSDPYGSALNGYQPILGPRFEVNATTGDFPYPFSNPAGATGDAIFKRVQVREAEFLVPDATFFVEGHYITADDAQHGLGLNNASHRRAIVTTSFNLLVRGQTQREDPAIVAWANRDQDVDLVAADYQHGGLIARFWIAARATDLGDGRWSYEYAIQNLNAHRAAGSFMIETGLGHLIEQIGFHDVEYHSGEPYDGTDWPGIEAGGAVAWATTESFDQNSDANALRWGTLYNYRFIASTPPTTGDVHLGLFAPGDPGDPDVLTVQTVVPAARCFADWNADGLVNTADFLAFLNDFNAVVGGSAPSNGNPDLASPFGVQNTADFIAFLNAYVAGC